MGGPDHKEKACFVSHRDYMLNKPHSGVTCGLGDTSSMPSLSPSPPTHTRVIPLIEDTHH